MQIADSTPRLRKDYTGVAKAGSFSLSCCVALILLGCSYSGFPSICAAAGVGIQGESGSTGRVTPEMCKSMFTAAENNDPEPIAKLLKGGVPVDIRDKDGRTPLMVASRNGKMDVVKFLVEKGADVNAFDSHGRSPLIDAMLDSQTEVVDYLRGRHAIDNPNLNRKTPRTPDSLFHAIDNNDIAGVQLMLDGGVEIECRDAGGMTPLMRACSLGFIDTVEVLLDRGASVSTGGPSTGKSAQLTGPTALCAAAESGQTRIVELLLNHHADAKVVFDGGDSPVISAIRSGNIETVRVVLDAGGQLDLKEKSWAMGAAAASGRIQMADWIYAKGGKVNEPNGIGRTPLHYAVLNRRPEMVRWLRAHGVKIDQIVDPFDNTALMTAMIFQAQDISIYDAMFEKIDDATDPAHPQPAPAPDVNLSTTDSRELGDLSSRGFTPMHYASYRCDARIIELFLNHGGAVDKADKLGQTPLDIAEHFKRIDVIELLKAHGAHGGQAQKNATR